MCIVLTGGASFLGLRASNVIELILIRGGHDRRVESLRFEQTSIVIRPERLGRGIQFFSHVNIEY